MTPSQHIVLVVDDDPQFGRLVASVAAKSGYLAHVVLDAREAWGLMDPEPTLVLLDLNMPGVDGLEMLRELSFRRCRARIVVSSGSDAKIQRSAVQIGRELGLRMGEPLAKPIPLALLRTVLAEAATAPAPATESESVQRRVTVDELRLALGRGELFVVYQPILDLKTLAPVGTEALVRWRHPSLGIVPPVQFVPLAESSGLVVEMTEQIFFHALEFCGRSDYVWEGRPLSISVNLATAALVERDLAGLLSSLLAASGVPPGRLIVEVTETAMRADRTSVLEVLSRLRLRGIELSIDDFGTGTSSLERLDQLPCTELKIERAFVGDVLLRPEAEAIVRSTLDLAHRLDLRVVAEGIETVETLRWLRAAGCATGQGFLFARGMEADDLVRWLGEWDARRAALVEAVSR